VPFPLSLKPKQSGHAVKNLMTIPAKSRSKEFKPVHINLAY